MSTSKTGKTWMRPDVKKAWREPALIVIVRGKPEEAVLGACKVAAGGGLGNVAGACYGDQGSCAYACWELVGS